MVLLDIKFLSALERLSHTVTESAHGFCISSSNSERAYYLLPREDQVITVRLSTGHCRFRHHMVPCGSFCGVLCGVFPLTVEHLLSDPPEPPSGNLGPVSWRPTIVKWRQFSQSNRHSTIGTRQTEYHEALPSSANVQSHLTSSFADDGNASWYSVCRVPMVKWRLDCEKCRHLTVVGLHDTGPWPADTSVRKKLYGPLPDLLRTAAFVGATSVAVWENDDEEKDSSQSELTWGHPWPLNPKAERLAKQSLDGNIWSHGITQP